MLRYRLITGPILIAFLLTLVWLDETLAGRALPTSIADLVGRDVWPPGSILVAAGLVAVALAALEVHAIAVALGGRPSAVLMSTSAVAGLAVAFAAPMLPSAAAATAAVATALVLVFVTSLLGLARTKQPQGAVHGVALTVLAFVYPGIALGFLLLLRQDHSAWWIVGVVMATKCCDIGAYFTGRAIGRRKLIPWLSPGKTWEGLAGGVLTSAAVGAGLAAASQLLPAAADQIAIGWGAVAGAVFGLLGQGGDLMMSLFKRDAGVKDASRILPGMGGVMDVLDSPLLVAPVAFWLLPLVASAG